MDLKKVDVNPGFNADGTLESRRDHVKPGEAVLTREAINQVLTVDSAIEEAVTPIDYQGIMEKVTANVPAVRGTDRGPIVKNNS